MTANAVVLLSKPRENAKTQKQKIFYLPKFFVDMMGARATPWDAEVLGLFVCQLASALRKGIKERQDHG